VLDKNAFAWAGEDRAFSVKAHNPWPPDFDPTVVDYDSITEEGLAT
jgi:hypothetical protein